MRAVTPVPALTVRDMCWADIPALVALDEALFGADAWSEATWWAELAERPRRDYVVFAPGPPGEGQSPLAYGGIDVGGDSADIMTLAVAPGSQGRGLGARVLAELEARATARGATHALLEVRSDNLSARILYDRHGWHELHVRRRYYQPGDVDAIILGKILPERAPQNGISR